ncbi:MAG: cysteine desulfurase [Gammaproteobacteria bacterium]|nr:cysteine desulfurase [Gammaproteobacteria bacterium]
MIYLDHNATTPVSPDVLDAMLPFLGKQFGNPSSLYRSGRTARTAIDVAREQVAALAGVTASQVIFTSGGTEANNLAMIGLSRELKPGKVAVSAIEHPSVLSPAQDYLSTQNWQTVVLPVNSSGIVDTRLICDAQAGVFGLVSVMLANNETGVLQDISALSNQCKQKNSLLHCDAVQAFGKIPVDFNALGVTTLSVSSHKINGPKGVGALIIDPGVKLSALCYGGGQEQTLRPGTENVAAIVGFGKAAELARTGLADHYQKLLSLRETLMQQLQTIEGCRIFSDNVERLPNTVQFAIDGVDGEMVLMMLDQAGIAVSSGSACASGSNAPSHVLQAMQVDAATARGAIRVSFGVTSEPDHIQQFMSVIQKQVSAWNFDDE